MKIKIIKEILLILVCIILQQFLLIFLPHRWYIKLEIIPLVCISTRSIRNDYKSGLIITNFILVLILGLISDIGSITTHKIIMWNSLTYVILFVLMTILFSFFVRLNNLNVSIITFLINIILDIFLFFHSQLIVIIKSLIVTAITYVIYNEA